MAQYAAPGVYVKEEPITPSITGVGTSTAGFIGASDGARMPNRPDPTAANGVTPYPLAAENEPVLVTDFEQFKRSFGDFSAGNKVLALSVYGFFNNGGSRCYVARVTDIDDDDIVKPALARFAAVDEIALVAVPGTASPDVKRTVITHCANENQRDRFAILDGLNATTVSETDIRGALGKNDDDDYAAMYFPYVMVHDPVTDVDIPLPPSGLIAGVYARVDAERGVHKAPANETLRGISGLAYQTTKAEQAGVNLLGINVIRNFNGRNVIWGASTLGRYSNKLIKYVNVRRLMIFLRESIDEGTQFAVFEPNSNPLWATITRSVSSFLTRVWRDGALFGDVAEKAFYVKCDESTNPPENREEGIVTTEIGVAPVKPAEFVVFRIAQFAEIPS
jgi:phage tail sheath protein FI